jgi:hypothetical protein
MSEATGGSPNVTGVQPNPVIDPKRGARGTHRLNSDSFMDGFEGLAEEAAAELAGDPKPKKPKERPRPQLDRPDKVKARRAEPEPEPEEETDPDDEEQQEAAELDDTRDDEEEVETSSEEQEEEEAPLLPPGKGTRENPLTLKDLPKDKFIKVKIDGVTSCVNLVEALEGTYMRPEYFHRQSHFVKKELEKGQQIATQAVQRLEALQGDFDAWIRDPEMVLSSFLDNEEFEQSLYKVLNGYLEILKVEKADPEKGLRRRRARDQKRIDARQRELDERDQRDQRTRTERAKQEQLQAAWKPGKDAGMEAAGFPELTPQLQDEIELRLTRRLRKNGQLTAKDWEEVIPEAAKSIDAKPITARERRPAPPPRSETREARPAARSNGSSTRDKFAALPFNQRMKDHKFFFRD